MYSKRILIFASLASLSLGSSAIAQLDLLPSIQKGSIQASLNPIATNLAAPNYAITAPGDPSRMFVVEQKGTLLVVQNNTVLPTPALDIQSRVAPPLNTTSVNDERGLLGLAFHPGYSNPSSPGYRTLYTFGSELIAAPANVTYHAPNTALNPLFPGAAVQGYKMVVNEWKRDAIDPNVIDPTSRREVFSYGKVANNHNGGTIAFGPDGYMYLGTGDGGNAYDIGASHVEPGGNAVNLSTPLGKMLRFDPLAPALTGMSSDPVSGNGQYRIPTTNPFQGVNQVPETYAYGLRNPYRFAFDDLPGGTGKLIAADVGQGNIEEINDVVLGGNYGWRDKEGTFRVNYTATTPPVGSIGVNSPEAPGSMIIDPIKGTLGYLQYDHQDGISITGGFVYRGTLFPDLVGKYVFGDLALTPGVRADGRLFYADLLTGVINEFQLPDGGFIPNGETLHGFGQDGNGELYALVQARGVASGGSVAKIYAIGIPEPHSGLLLLMATAGAFFRRRR